MRARLQQAVDVDPIAVHPDNAFEAAIACLDGANT
jgi:hypothetical protein